MSSDESLPASLSSATKHLPSEDPQALHDRADTLLDDGKYAEACALYEQLVAMAEAEHGPEHPEVGNALNDWLECCSSWATTRWPDRRPNAP